ncbi:MAG: aldose 1-epimerase [Bryobacter sp.]
MGNFGVIQELVGQVPVVRLTCEDSQTELAASPAYGGTAFRLQHKGKPVFYAPDLALDQLIAQRKLCGNPILAPWANRIDGMSYMANGQKFQLNAELGNLRLDQNKNPIHGLVTFSKRWETVEATASESGARVRFALDFGKYPDWLAQFPFPHRIEITYLLQETEVEVRTEVFNHAAEPMPLAVGYHPYFQITDAPRDEWKVTLPVRQRYTLSPKLIPTGELTENPHRGTKTLAGLVLDDVFGGIERDAQGLATFAVEGRSQRIEVVYGKTYEVAVVYAPAGQNFICFEPMTAPTNGFNMPGAAKTIAPAGSWRESYWIRLKGY